MREAAIALDKPEAAEHLARLILNVGNQAMGKTNIRLCKEETHYVKSRYLFLDDGLPIIRSGRHDARLDERNRRHISV
jgi:hypothetical protein